MVLLRQVMETMHMLHLGETNVIPVIYVTAATDMLLGQVIDAYAVARRN